MTAPLLTAAMDEATVKKLQAFVEGVVVTLNKTVAETAGTWIDTLIDSVCDLFKVVDEHWITTALSNYVAEGVLSREDLLQIDKFMQVFGVMKFPLTPLVMMMFAGQYMQQMLLPAFEKIQQKQAKVARPALPSYSSAIAAAFIAPEKTAQVREYLAKQGFADDVIDLLFISNYRLYDELTIRDCWLRGILDDNKMYERMRELGYTDTRIGEITKTWSLIPPVQDILTMVGHEAFEPDSIKEMGLDAEFPEEQSEWLTKQGLSPFWQMKYWISHWEQPSVQMGFEMYQRNVINREQLDFLFRTVEIPQYWREKLLKIAYVTFTRVDTRRMYGMGVLNFEEVIRAYKDQGYDEYHATKLAEFTKKSVIQKEKDLTKSEILSGYQERIIPKADATRLIKAMGYDDAETEYLLLHEDYKVEKALQTEQVSAIQYRYVNKLISQADAHRLLGELNLPEASVESKLAAWSAKIIEDTKVPSKSDLDKFLRNKIIGVDTYRAEMRRLGYGATYIEWYEKLAMLGVAGE